MIRIKPGQPRFTYWPRRYETPSDIFRKGDLGGLWGPNHFTDVEGTIPATLGDKIAAIEDPKTQTINWVQANPDYRPTLLDGKLSFVEGRGNIESVETYPAGFYTVVFAGTLGIWIDTMEWEGGKFRVGISSYSGGPAGVLAQLGDLQVEGCILISRELTKSEKEYLINYFGGEVQDFWSPEELFTNGEQGSFWGPLPYYNDAAGTVEAGWGDPVGNIPDASGNGAAWSQVTSTARPILGRVPVGGRRNILVNNTQLLSGWSNSGNQVSVAHGFPDPFGGNDAFRITVNAVGGNNVAVLIGATVPHSLAGKPCTASVWVRRHSGSSNVRFYFDGSYPGSATPTNEWERVEVNFTGGADGANRFDLRFTNVGSETDVYLPQLEAGSEATPIQICQSAHDVTEAGVNEIHYLRFDGTDDQVTTTLPAISGGTIVLAGTNGIWIDSLDFAGGAFSVGPGTYTGGPTGLMSILGDLLVEGGFVIDRALTPKEIAQVKRYYKARGAGDFLVPLDPSVVAVIRPTVDTSPENWIRYHNGKSYPDGPEWQGIIDAHPAYAGIASEVIDSQHMVKVPKFYVQTKDTAAGGVIYAVSDHAIAGFDTHPAFFNAGEELDQFWIGAYHASEVDNVFESQPNVLPRVALSGVTAIERMEARNTGGQAGWGSLTWHQICAVRLLCLIEIGTPDPRTVIGQGWNSITSNSGDGAALQPTGTSDANWRGIYDLYGNVHTLCTGLEFRDGRAWLADENGELVDTGHDMPETRYIGACAGGDLGWAFLPKDDGPAGFSAGYRSYQWMNTSGVRAARHGGAFADSPATVGAFSLAGTYTLARTTTASGFRLAKV